MNNLITLLIPGSSFYQLFQLSKSQREYASNLKTLNISTAEMGSEFIAKTPHPDAEKFYNTCRTIDRLNAHGYVASLAKTIVGLSIVFFCASTAFGLVGVGIALEGCFQATCSIYQMRKLKWHVVEEFHKVHPDILKLRYDGTTRVVY